QRGDRPHRSTDRRCFDDRSRHDRWRRARSRWSGSDPGSSAPDDERLTPQRGPLAGAIGRSQRPASRSRKILEKLMYNEGGGAALGAGGALSAGSLAFTGFSVMGFAIVAFVLILTGVLLLRLTTVKRAQAATSMVDAPFDPFAALASAVVATSSRGR